MINTVSQKEGKNDNILPIQEHEADIQRLIENNDECIIIGSTGSGKTTHIPIIIKNIMNSGEKLIITQPRKIATRSVSKHVAKLLDTQLGKTVGYQVRYDKQLDKQTPIQFVTDGILLNKMQHDRLLKEYQYVMIDEAHERGLNIDLILGMLKVIQAKREKKQLKKLKIIITSATIQHETFTKFFNNAPHLKIPGRLYSVDTKYLSREEYESIQNKKSQIYTYIKKQVENILASKEKGDILIFLSGKKEIASCIKKIEEIEDIDNTILLPLHAELDKVSQNKIFEDTKKRKIVVSTNIAETSITVPGIKYVIDSGEIKVCSHDPESGFEELIAEEHSQAGCEQRSGRAGRTEPGNCYRMYSKKNYKERPKFGTPNILNANLAGFILKTKVLGIKNIKNDFPFITKPKDEQINSAIQHLKELKALDENMNLTKWGYKLSLLPLEPEQAHMVLKAREYDHTNDIITIAAFLEAKNISQIPLGQEETAWEIHNQYKHESSDFLTYINIWNESEKNTNNIQKWCEENFFNAETIKEVSETREQIQNLLLNSPKLLWKGTKKEQDIRQTIIDSFQHKKIQKNEKWSYQKSGETIYIHPSSTMRKNPQEIIAHRIVRTERKIYAITCQNTNIENNEDEIKKKHHTKRKKGKKGRK